MQVQRPMYALVMQVISFSSELFKQYDCAEVSSVYY